MSKVYVFTCIFVYAYIQVHIHACTYACINMHMYVCIHKYYMHFRRTAAHTPADMRCECDMTYPNV